MPDSYSSACIEQNLRDNQNLLAQDRCLLNTGLFQYICLI